LISHGVTAAGATYVGVKGANYLWPVASAAAMLWGKQALQKGMSGIASKLDKFGERIGKWVKDAPNDPGVDDGNLPPPPADYDRIPPPPYSVPEDIPPAPFPAPTDRVQPQELDVEGLIAKLVPNIMYPVMKVMLEDRSEVPVVRPSGGGSAPWFVSRKKKKKKKKKDNANTDKSRSSTSPSAKVKHEAKEPATK
jgi:hypothetical protein